MELQASVQGLQRSRPACQLLVPGRAATGGRHRQQLLLQCAARHQPDRRRSDVSAGSAVVDAVLPSACSTQLLQPAGGGSVSVSSSSSASGARIRIAVDVDEVLGRFLYTLNAFCREAHGLDYDVGDYHVYNFAEVWDCTQDESNHIVHDFFQSQHFATGIPPIPGALESLRRLQAHGGFELVVVTSRQHVIQAPTLAWIERHFPGVFAEVHFGNHWALEGRSKKKSEICREIGASVLIDDNPAYALECAAEGLHVLLYDWQDGYPWSKTACGPTHPNITRVHDWQHVEGALAGIVAGMLAQAPPSPPSPQGEA